MNPDGGPDSLPRRLLPRDGGGLPDQKGGEGSGCRICGNGGLRRGCRVAEKKKGTFQKTVFRV